MDLKDNKTEMENTGRLIPDLSVPEKVVFWAFAGAFLFIPAAKSPFIIAGALALAVWIFSGLFWRKRANWLRRESIPAALLLVLPWLGLIYSENTHYGFRFAESSYYWLYVFAIGSLSFGHFLKRDLLIKLFLAGIGFTAAVSLLQKAGLVPMKYPGNPTGFLSGGTSHGLLSLFLAFGILVLSFYFGKARGIRTKLLISSLILLDFAAMAAGQGRSGQLAFVILSPVFVFNMLGRKHLWKVFAGAALVVVLLGFSPMVQKRFTEGVNDIKQYRAGNPDTSLGLRFTMWKMAADLFISHPLLGTGSGGFGTEWRRRNPVPGSFEFDDPHNAFFYTASGFGIVGLSAYLLLIFQLIRSGWLFRSDVAGFSVLVFGLILLIASFYSSMIVTAANAAWVSAFAGISLSLCGGKTAGLREGEGRRESGGAYSEVA